MPSFVARSDSLWCVFQHFVPAHISSCCTQIWVNLLPLLGTHSLFSHLYCSSVVTPTYMLLLFFSSRWCSVVFSANGVFFISTGSYIYFLSGWPLFQSRTNPVCHLSLNRDDDCLIFFFSINLPRRGFGLLAHFKHFAGILCFINLEHRTWDHCVLCLVAACFRLLN